MSEGALDGASVYEPPHYFPTFADAQEFVARFHRIEPFAVARDDPSSLRLAEAAGVGKQWEDAAQMSRALASTIDESIERAKRANARQAANAAAEWPEIQPLRVDTRAEPYPTDALPGVIGAAVREVVAYVQCPDALAACSAFSVVSLAAQGLVNVRRDDGLIGPPSLFLLVAAASGERKTSCDGYFSSAVRQWEADQGERARPDIVSHSAASKVWEARRDGLLAKIKELSRQNKPSEAEARSLAELEADRPVAPRVPRILYGDITPEALAFNLTRWPSAAVQSSEAGMVLGGHGMKPDSAMRNLALLNVLWEGGAISVDRRQSDSFSVRGARLTMGLAVQPETVRAFLDATRGLARGSGFAARFLIAWPESTQGTRRFREAPTSWPALETFHRRVTELLNAPLSFEESGELVPATLHLSPEAKAAWVEFHDSVESELRPGGEMEEARDVASKAADNAARLGALFHVFEHGPTGNVSEAHMRAGAAIAAWHLYEARRFLGMLGQPKAVANAGKLETWALKYCHEHGTQAAPRREAQQFAVRDGAALDEAIEELRKAGRARLRQEGARKLIELHPYLIGANRGA